MMQNISNKPKYSIVLSLNPGMVSIEKDISDKTINTCGWIRLPAKKYKNINSFMKITTCQYAFKINYNVRRKKLLKSNINYYIKILI